MVAGSSLVPPEWSSLWRGSIHRGDLARSTGLAFFVTISPQQVTPPYESSRRRSSPIQVTQIHPAYSGANDRVGSRTGPSRTEVTSSLRRSIVLPRQMAVQSNTGSRTCSFLLRGALHYLPGPDRENISQGVISCQRRLDPAGNTGGGLHSLVPRAVGNSDITPNIFQRNEASPGSSS